jgi:predicted PurR-regulated permease PerM
MRATAREPNASGRCLIHRMLTKNEAQMQASPPRRPLPSEGAESEAPAGGAGRVTFDRPVALSILATVSIIAFLYFARPVMLPLVAACMVAAGLNPLMRLFSYFKIPTVPSAVIIFIALVLLTGVGLARLGQPAVMWINDAPRHLSDLRSQVHRFFPDAERTGQAVATVTGMETSEAAKKGAPDLKAAETPGNATEMLNWTGTAVAQLGETLVLVCLLLAGGNTFTRKIIGMLPKPQDKKRAAEICQEMRHNISTYMFSVSLINITLGILCAIGFFLLGLPRPGMWGMIVTLLNFVPYFGPIFGIMLVAVVGLLSFDTVSQSLLPAAWYLGLHLLEANFVTPLLLSRRFSLNPVVIFFSLMFGLWIWGVTGALLAVPILVSVKTICARIPSVSAVSDIIGR